MDNQTYIILGDIHNRIKQNEYILRNENYDQIISVGDFYDDFNDNITDAIKTAKWVKSWIHKPNFHVMWANHCLHYAFNNRYVKCSGYTDAKFNVINSILTRQDWDKYLWYFWLDTILITHAGLDYRAYNTIDVDEIKNNLEKDSILANKALYNNESHWFYRTGFSRGGNQEFGGIVWLDFNEEFMPIKGLKTIQGHTRQREPAYKGKDNLCLDTDSNHYALVKNGQITIKKFSDL